MLGDSPFKILAKIHLDNIKKYYNPCEALWEVFRDKLWQYTAISKADFQEKKTQISENSMNAIDFWIHNVLMNITNEKRADIEWIQEVIFSDQQEENKNLFNISGRSVDIFTVKKINKQGLA